MFLSSLFLMHRGEISGELSQCMCRREHTNTLIFTSVTYLSL